MPTNTSDEQIPELVANKPVQQLHLPVQSPSDEEVDREVEVIWQSTWILSGKVTFTS